MQISKQGDQCTNGNVLNKCIFARVYFLCHLSHIFVSFEMEEELTLELICEHLDTATYM